MRYEEIEVKEKYKIISKIVDYDYGFIGKIYRNGAFRMIFTYPIESSNESLVESKDKYEWFEHDVTKSIANGMAVAAYDVSVEGTYLGGSWILSPNEYNKVVTRNMSTAKWSHGTVKGGEARMMLNMIWYIN